MFLISRRDSKYQVCNCVCVSFLSLGFFLSLTMWLVEIGVGVLSPISTDQRGCGLMSIFAWFGMGVLSQISTNLLCFGGGRLRQQWV